MFGYASSCIYGMFLVKVVLLFQKTEMRKYLSQLLLRYLNVFKYLALQSEFFTAIFVQQSITRKMSYPKRNAGCLHLPLLWIWEVCSGGFFIVVYEHKAVKIMMLS